MPTTRTAPQPLATDGAWCDVIVDNGQIAYVASDNDAATGPLSLDAEARFVHALLVAEIGPDVPTVENLTQHMPGEPRTLAVLHKLAKQRQLSRWWARCNQHDNEQHQR